MNPRQRYIETVTFGNPDKIPFMPGGPRESTIKAWHEQGLPEGADWHTHLLELLGMEPEKTKPEVDLGVDFLMMPQFEQKVLEHKDDHYIVQDWKGNICEISDEFDVTYLKNIIFRNRYFVNLRFIFSKLLYKPIYIFSSFLNGPSPTISKKTLTPFFFKRLTASSSNPGRFNSVSLARKIKV